MFARVETGQHDRLIASKPGFFVDWLRVTPLVLHIGGTISPDVPQVIKHNETVEFSFSQKQGYFLDGVNGTYGGELMDNTYVTSFVTSDCNVIGSFKEKPFPYAMIIPIFMITP